MLSEFVTPLFVLGASFTLVGALRGRGVWLAGVGGVMSAVGALAAVAGAATHLVVLTLVTAGAPATATTAVMAAPLPDALFFALFSTPIALLLLAAAAWRARVVTWIPFSLVVVGTVLDVSGLLPAVVSVAAGLAGFPLILWPLAIGGSTAGGAPSVVAGQVGGSAEPASPRATR